MSKVVDEKVVQMKFDNSNFQSKVKDTIISLDNLQTKLKEKDFLNGKGLEKLGESANKVDMSGLSRGIETVHNKFSALQVMGVTALANLTNSAVEAGKRIASSLTDSLVNGGRNRALNIQNAKFQIEGLLGKEDYAKQWDRIDESINYAVKDTAYGYDSAAKAASQFLASDVKVGEQMDKSLRAISGVAAMTNSTYDDIANVFTRVAGQGRVMATDLNSLAARGMNAAATLGKAYGKTESEIRDMVSKGQISFEMFANAMDDAFGEHAKEGNKTFEGALANMKAAMGRIGAKVWDPLLNNQRDVFNQMRLLINDLNNNYLDGPINALNDKLTQVFQNIVKFFDLGGMKNILLGIGDVLKVIGDVLKPIKDAFYDIFPKKSVETLVEATKRFKEFTEKLKISEETANRIRTIFKGVFSVFDIGIEAVKALAKGFGNLLSHFSGVPGGILGITSALGAWVTKQRDSIKESNIFSNVVGSVVNVLGNFTEKIKGFCKEFDIFGGLVKTLKGIFNFIKKLGIEIGKFLGEIIRTGDLQAGLKTLNTGLFGGLLFNLIKFVDNFRLIAMKAKDSTKTLSYLLGNLNGVIRSFSMDLKAEAIVKIAKALLVLAAALLVLSLIDPVKLGSGLTTITIALTEMLASLKILSKFDGELIDTVQIMLLGSIIRSLATSMLILSAALKIIGSMDLGQTLTALVAFTAVLGEMIGVIYALPKEKDIMTSVQAIKQLARSLILISLALKIMSTIETGDMIKSLVAMATCIYAVTKSIDTMPAYDKDTKIVGLMSLAMGMLVLSGVLKILATMSWEDIAKSMVVMGSALFALTTFLKKLPDAKELTTRMNSLNIMAIGLGFIATLLKILATMSWEEIAKSLVAMGVALTELVIFTKKLGDDSMTKTTGMISFTASLILLATAMKILGSMNIGEVVTALLALAGGLTILGVAGKLLENVAGTLAKLGTVFMMFGAGVALVGVGLVAIGAGIASIATALGAGTTMIVAGISAIILGVASLIPELINIFGQAIVSICNVIKTGTPLIADTILTVIEGILKSLRDHGPMIIQYLAEFIILTLKEMKQYLPEFIDAAFEVIKAFIEGLGRGLQGLEPILDLEGVLSLVGLTILTKMLAGLKGQCLAALKGVLILGAVIAALAVVLAAIGALAQIPGLDWLVAEGGNLLQAIGTAIGQFIGGIIGGVALGATAVLPMIADSLSQFMEKIQPFVNGARVIDGSVLVGAGILAATVIAMSAAELVYGITQLLTIGTSLEGIGDQLSKFMNNAKGFIEGVKMVDPSILNSVAALAKAIIILTAADLVQGITKFITLGGSGDLGKFGEQLPPLATAINGFVTNLGTFGEDKVASVMAASNVLLALAECASKIPNTGGIGALFTGDNDISQFGDKLPDVGKHISEFVNNLGTFGEDKLAAARCACEVLRTLALASSDIPNSGGMAAFFAGDNDISKFAHKLPGVGKHISEFVQSLGDFGEGQVNTVKVACEAIVALASAASDIPNTGGLVALFTGDNDISTFANKFPGVGKHLAEMVTNLGTFDESQIKTVDCAARAIKALATAASEIPNTGGLVALFTGDNDLGTFSGKFPGVGKHLAEMVMNLGTFDEGQIKTVDCAGRAIKALAAAASEIPNTGGLAALFAGDNDISQFSDKFPKVGKNLNEFITNLGTFDEGQIKTVDCAARAIKTLANTASQVPSVGGLVSWFMGETDISQFTGKFPGVGKNLNEFITNLGTFGEEQITTTDCAGRAIKMLALAANEIPNTGGLVSWFTGDNDISKFASKFPDIGIHLASFVSNLGTFGKPQVITVDCAGQAIKTFASAANEIPNTGGLGSLFNGDNDISKFAGKFGDVGNGLRQFIDAIGTFTKDQVNTVKYAGEALKTMVQVGNSIQDDKSGDKLKKISDKFWDIGNNVGNLVRSQSDVSLKALQEACEKLKNVANTIDFINNMKADNTNNFNKCLEELAKNGTSYFYNTLKSEESLNKARDAANSFIDAFIRQVDNNRNGVYNKFKEIAIAAYNGMVDSGILANVTNLGRYFVQGFANGINNNVYMARDAGSNVGSAALNAAKAAIDSNSPSRETFKLGKFFDQGLVNGIKALMGNVYKTSYNVGTKAKSGLSNAISKISDVINSDVDTQPRIRPILDLSDVKSGAGQIKTLFGSPSLGISSNLRAISANMSANRQNGTNKDVIKAINKLGDVLGENGNTYIVDGITYDDGSNVQDAVKSLITAARIERRK